MEDRDILQKIKDDADNIEIPAALAPENIEKILAAKKQTETAADQKPAPPGRSKISRYAIRYGSIAAVLAVGFTAFWQYQHISGRVKYSVAPAADIPEADVSDNTADIAETEFSDASALPETGFDENSADVTEQFTYAQSYEDIYDALREKFYVDNNSGYDYGTDLYVLEDSADIAYPEDAAMESVMEAKSASGSEMTTSGYAGTGTAAADFSDTNIQEQGVDEGDIIKTDGKYIYILRTDLSLAIVKADGRNSDTVSITDLSAGNDARIQEMYLDGDTLSVILTEYVSSLNSEDDYIYYSSSKNQVRLITFDISDRSSPVQTGAVTQDGSYSDSRKAGSYIYLFSRYYPDIRDTWENSTIMPRLNGETVPAERFYLPETLNDSTYLVISSLDTRKPDRITDSRILVSGASGFYVSTENIYITNENYDSAATRTEIAKFHYADGKITGAASCTVPGYLNNSFSMNEYNGSLRVVTTYYGDAYNEIRDFVSRITDEYFEENWTEHNALYVLDENLKQIGAIEGLAEGETIRSARFFGDTAYFVTYRQTDPLFSVDLSDPANPRILGELKVSGFSSYLHFYGDGLLLGIGYEGEEETGTITGVKLSMFDVSDPSGVTELHRFVLPGITWCPAIEDYKSILVSPEKNLIGFYCDNRYMVFSYDKENGFTRKLLYDFYADMLTDQAEYNTLRGLYIGDDFYLAGNTFLVIFDMEKGFRQEDVLEIGAADLASAGQ